MPIRKRWSAFTFENLYFVPMEQGVYELGDSKEIVYIGSSSERGEDIRGRLLFHKRHKPRSVKFFRFELASFFESAIAMEEWHCNKFFNEHGRLPRLQKRMPRGYLNPL